MTQHVYNLDWYAGNETIKYPLDSKASCIPMGYDYVPQELLGVITDISFSIPNSITDPYLSALSITDDLLSLIICSDTTPIFALSITQNSLYVNRYYTLTSFVSGCSGVIVFGEAAKMHRCAYKFSNADQAGFLPSVYHSYMVYPVLSIGRKDGVSAYQKDIIFKGSGDVQITTDSVKLNGKSVDALVFSLKEGSLPKYIGSCDGRPESDTCSRSSIEKITCVTPDDNGNIAIEGEDINIEVSEGQLVLSTNYTVKDVCPTDKFNELIAEDYCCDDCQKKEESEDESTGCSGKVKSINFNQDVEGSGIAIDYRGITTEEPGVIPLTISKLSNILYFSIRVSWLDGIDDGYCQITYGDGQSVVTIRRTEVSWDRTYTLYDSDTYTYPNRVEVTIDHCNGSQSLWGDGKKITESNCNTSPFSVNITFKGCTIAAIKYRNE